MKDKADKSMSTFCMVEHNDTVVVALSGGADSVALLHYLNSVKEKYNLRLFACHVNHMIRFDEADADEAFVTDLCAQLGVELFVEKVDVPALAKKQKISLELCGRNVRYDFFEKLHKNLYAKIATAHTASDNVETVLYNLARGTSVTGLCGITPKRDYIIRPLIECSRADVEKYCVDNGLRYVTDSTNLSDDYTRNNIRHNAVPTLLSVNPDLCSAVSRMTKNMSHIKQFIDECSLKEIKRCKTEYGYSCKELLKLDKAILSNVIYLICKDSGADVSQKHIEMICKSLSDCGCVDISAKKRAVCRQGVLRISDKELCDDVSECSFQDYPNKKYISAEEIKNIHKNLLKDCISCDIITEQTVFRTKREGDSFTFFDRGVTKTVKKLFNEMKIPAEKRNSIPLVANGNTVLWIYGIGASKQARVKDNFPAYKIRWGVHKDEF